jgi:hypothetical protein
MKVMTNRAALHVPIQRSSINLSVSPQALLPRTGSFTRLHNFSRPESAPPSGYAYTRRSALASGLITAYVILSTRDASMMDTVTCSNSGSMPLKVTKISRWSQPETLKAKNYSDGGQVGGLEARRRQMRCVWCN